MTPQQQTRRKPVWAVIGGGNGGQALAGHLALMGFSVRLYDIVPDTIEAINAQKGIAVDGAVHGFGRLEAATLDMREALSGADIVMVVAPAIAHRQIARDCARFLADGQIVFVHPGATGGALEFQKTFADQGISARVTIAESNSLLYACRSARPGQVDIFGIKRELMVSALPATETEPVLASLKNAFPQLLPGRNVLETSLSNPNAMMHPAPTLLNTSLIESGRDWLYYHEGITPSIGDFVEALDRERVAVARAFDLDIPPIRSWYKRAYDVNGATLSEAVKNNPAYAGVKGQKQLQTRYLLEDIPMGLVPMAALGQLAGVDVRRIQLVIDLAECLTCCDLTTNARNLERLGLSGLSVPAILQRIESGL